MAVTPADVAVELGRAAPESGSVQESQLQSWIDQALYLIGKRLTLADLDPADVDHVVLLSVAAHARNPEDATQVTTSIDDSTSSRTYKSGAGRVRILDELWGLLDPDLANESGVGSTRLYGEPDMMADRLWLDTTAWFA